MYENLKIFRLNSAGAYSIMTIIHIFHLFPLVPNWALNTRSYLKENRRPNRIQRVASARFEWEPFCTLSASAILITLTIIPSMYVHTSLIDPKPLLERAWVFGASCNFSACQSFIKFPSLLQRARGCAAVFVGHWYGCVGSGFCCFKRMRDGLLFSMSFISCLRN